MVDTIRLHLESDDEDDVPPMPRAIVYVDSQWDPVPGLAAIPQTIVGRHDADVLCRTFHEAVRYEAEHVLFLLSRGRFSEALRVARWDPTKRTIEFNAL